MIKLSNTHRVTVKESTPNNNALGIRGLKEIYKKILANIMIKNEIGALFWVKELKEREIKQVSKDQELAWLYPWPCTLIESAEAAGTDQVKAALTELF